MNTTKRTISVIGDLMLDVVTYLLDVSLARIDDQKGLQIQEFIDMLIGGTAVHAALAAIQQGFSSVTVIGKIGFKFEDNQPDVAAKIILASLLENGVKCAISHDYHLTTGTTMITYLANNSRLFVSNRGANGSFVIQDITQEMLDAVRDADVTFVSGYSLLVPEQANAVLRLMEEAHGSGKFVVLDVVPHQIYKFVDKSMFQKYTRLVNLLITEVNTIKRFLPEFANVDKAQTDRIAEHLLKQHDVVILRPMDDMQCIFDRLGLIESKPTGYDEIGAEKRRGFLDRMNMKILSDYYPRFVGKSK